MGAKITHQRMDYGALAEAPGAIAKAIRPRRERKGLPAKNEERAAEQRRLQFGPQSSACRRLPCAACGKVPTKDAPNEAHHVTTRGAGGLDRDTIPLCPICHARAGHVGALTFWSELGLEVADILDAVREWMASGCPVGSLPTGRRG